jgi:hypothetical protein
MGLAWNEIPESVQNNFEKSLLLKVPEMNAMSFSRLLKGSNAMNYDWNQREIKHQIFSRLNRLYGHKDQVNKQSEKELAAIIYSLGKTRIAMKWETLSPIIGESLFKGIECCSAVAFDSFAVSAVLYG